MPSQKTPSPDRARTVALCYVRLSMTRDVSDLDSPERQRANIQAECDRRGWIPEWYEDAEGHKSGTQEENRPGWLALKARLADPDVAGIVANDLSRLHRKGWRVGSLIDFIEYYHLSLVLAAPGRNLDLGGATGKITAMIMALMDEYYATDISEKQKDSVRHRQSKGIIVGGIPFGTERNENGHLQATSKGVWLLPDGSVYPGHKDEPSPAPNARWRGFAEAARRCLELYAGNQYGRRRIAQILNAEGYHYRDVHGLLDEFVPDDIRRIAANWVEYGGAVLFGRARSRRAQNVKPETVTLVPERAVFDIELCYRVGTVRLQRTRDVKRNPENAVRLDSKVYSLSKLVYCAHCERLAETSGNPALRSYLTGKTGNKKEARRYRHDTERRCSAQKRSVMAEVLEADFRLLLDQLTVNPESLPLLAAAVAHFNRSGQPEEAQRAIQEEIAHWRQRSKNADKLFGRARISEAEWRTALDEAEHEIARLQSQIMEQHDAEIGLRMTMEMIANLIEHWSEANHDHRRALANGLFEYLIYNLDTQRIVGFKLKPWAELLMQLRITLESGSDNDPDGGTDGGAKREPENSNDSDASQSDGSAKQAPENDNDPNDEGIIDSRKQRVVWCTRRGFNLYLVPRSPSLINFIPAFRSSANTGICLN